MDPDKFLNNFIAVREFIEANSQFRLETVVKEVLEFTTKASDQSILEADALADYLLTHSGWEVYSVKTQIKDNELILTVKLY